jgi:hypothetical protein
MSAVLEAIEAECTTEKVKKVTEKLAPGRQDLHWRYDLVSSRRFPVQYYATALRGSGPDADEILTIGIECFESDNGHLIVSGMITGEDGVIIAQGPSTEIDIPSESAIERNPSDTIDITIGEIQGAFDSLVSWVDAQRQVIGDALART